MRPEYGLLLLLLPLLGMLALEIRRAKWTLCEGVVATLVLGHVVALPIVLAWHRAAGEFPGPVLAGAALGIGLAAAMAYGTFWVFRSLHVIKETRTSVRLGYMLLGMLSIPFLFLPGVNLAIWWPLIELHRNARGIGPAAIADEIVLQDLKVR